MNLHLFFQDAFNWIASHRYAYLSLHGYLLLLHLPHVPFNKHTEVSARFIASLERSNFASFT